MWGQVDICTKHLMVGVSAAGQKSFRHGLAGFLGTEFFPPFSWISIQRGFQSWVPLLITVVWLPWQQCCWALQPLMSTWGTRCVFVIGASQVSLGSWMKPWKGPWWHSSDGCVPPHKWIRRQHCVQTRLFSKRPLGAWPVGYFKSYQFLGNLPAHCSSRSICTTVGVLKETGWWLRTFRDTPSTPHHNSS